MPSRQCEHIEIQFKDFFFKIWMGFRSAFIDMFRGLGVNLRRVNHSARPVGQPCMKMHTLPLSISHLILANVGDLIASTLQLQR